MKRKNKIRLTCIALILALSPVLLFDRSGEFLRFNEVNADIGTCCAQDGSICVIPPLAVHNFYALPAGNPCPPDWGPMPLPDPGTGN